MRNDNRTHGLQTSCRWFDSTLPSMNKDVEEEIEKGASGDKGSKKVGYVIVGYVIPDLTAAQAASEPFIVPDIVFSSEKGMHRKELVFPTLDKAKAAILKRYGRE